MVVCASGPIAPRLRIVKYQVLRALSSHRSYERAAVPIGDSFEGRSRDQDSGLHGRRGGSAPSGRATDRWCCGLTKPICIRRRRADHLPYVQRGGEYQEAEVRPSGLHGEVNSRAPCTCVSAQPRRQFEGERPGPTARRQASLAAASRALRAARRGRSRARGSRTGAATLHAEPLCRRPSNGTFGKS